MQNSFYEFNIFNPDFKSLGYVIAIANIKDKHDRSAPSDFHWKILKCRMILFSNSSVLACPEKKELQQIHIIFNKAGDVYDKLNSLFLKFSLVQDGGIRKPTADIFQICFHYTLTAKIAPVWNTLGYDYFINNRDFLVTSEPQEGVKYQITSSEDKTILRIKPVKIHLLRADEDFVPGEWIRVFPSLNKAIVDNCSDSLPSSGNFKCYKDLRRHWKNIHGYRLPEDERSYCTVQFWRGEPLTYPKMCVTRNFPIITPITKSSENLVLTRFLACLKNKMSHVLGAPLNIHPIDDQNLTTSTSIAATNEIMSETQAVSLCTPTQYQRH